MTAKKKEIILTHRYIIRNIHRTDVCCIWTDNSIHNTALINASKITKRNLYVVHQVFISLLLRMQIDLLVHCRIYCTRVTQLDWNWLLRKM